MTRALIAGSGSEIPPFEVTNDTLARIMDTSDAWIRERTGVETRHYVEAGTSTTDLAVPAARRALESAGVDAAEIDLVVFATMTPDHFFPGNGGLLQTRLGLRPVPCFDIRQQCSGFLYGLQLVDAHIRSGMTRTALLVGAEVHTGFMPWGDGSWARLNGDVEAPISQAEWDFNTRGWTHSSRRPRAARRLRRRHDLGRDPRPRLAGRVDFHHGLLGATRAAGGSR